MVDSCITNETIDELVNDIRKTVELMRARETLTDEFEEALRDTLVCELVRKYATNLARYIAHGTLDESGHDMQVHSKFCALDRAFGTCPLDHH